MKRKLLLVLPKTSQIEYGNMKFISSLTRRKGGMLSSSLAVVAGLTPDEFDVRIIDENLETINFDENFDIVGITGFPDQIDMAGGIAEKFRKRGALIVCGGPSVSISPERWSAFADVLIRGEAERIWPRFIADYLTGSYKTEYWEKEKFELNNMPVPDYSSIPTEIINQYMVGLVQTSRGCPFNCEFCSVIVYLGRKMRYKPVDTALREVDQLYKMGFRLVFLADDNFAANRETAKNILRALRDWNRKLKNPMGFITQVSIDTAKDDEFLELAVEAGMRSVFIGIETPNTDSLKESGKLHNINANVLNDVKKFQEHGIFVQSGCIVGFDSDDLSIFQRQFDFFSKTGVAMISVYPLQAADGTRLKERVIKEGRYIDQNESSIKGSENKSIFNTVTIKPKQMTVSQLQQGVFWLLWKLYNPLNFTNRVKIFFETFENSPKKNRLNIPKPRLSIEVIGMIWRIFKYYIFSAGRDEKTALSQMLGYARRSCLPNRYNLVISAFLTMKNTQKMILEEEPLVDKITYPIKKE